MKTEEARKVMSQVESSLGCYPGVTTQHRPGWAAVLRGVCCRLRANAVGAEGDCELLAIDTAAAGSLANQRALQNDHSSPAWNKLSRLPGQGGRESWTRDVGLGWTGGYRVLG